MLKMVDHDCIQEKGGTFCWHCGKKMSIYGFRDEYRFLSNFYPSTILIGEGVYPTVEHFYQSMKTEDSTEKQKIIDAKSPGKAKKLGYKCTLRKDWDEIKLQVMLVGVLAKFKQHDDLREKLLATGSMWIAETNDWGDDFWGVCGEAMEGRNEMGKTLMKIRRHLMKIRGYLNE